MRYLVLPPPPRKYVRALRAATRPALRMAAWNAAFIIAGLLLIALAGEAYFRLTRPFIETEVRSVFVDGVGLIREPNAELRYASWRDDHFLVSRANSLGFLDREPVSAERAAAGCHIAFIGDSFVEAWQAPIADKFQARLEEMAARELPHLDVTTQAYGISGIGQINQIPFYDEYARRLSPKLVVLVFVINDFGNNITALRALENGWDPDRMPYMSAQRDARGNLELRPPDPEYKRFLLHRPPKAWRDRAWDRLTGISYFAKWTSRRLRNNDIRHQQGGWADMLSERPCCAWLSDGRTPPIWSSWHDDFMEEGLPPVLEDGLEYTAFGIDQFKRRTDRDDAALLIMTAGAGMGKRGDPQFDRLSAIAEARGIPVISDYDYVVSQGYDARDGRWPFDRHWNATGHRWAAEAVLEWLKANRDVCD